MSSMVAGSGLSRISVSRPGLVQELTDLRKLHGMGGRNISRYMFPQKRNVPRSIIEAQIPLTSHTVNPTWFPNINNLQNTVGRIRVVSGPDEEVIASGSAVVINPSGLVLTANHVAEHSPLEQVAGVFEYRGNLYVLLEKGDDVKLYLDIPSIVQSNSTLDGVVLTSYPLEILDLNEGEDLALLRISGGAFNEDPATFAQIETHTSAPEDPSIKIGHIAGVPFNCLSEGKVLLPAMNALEAHYFNQESSSYWNQDVVAVEGNRIDRIAAGPGDSGGGMFNGNFRLTGIPLYVHYREKEQSRPRIYLRTPFGLVAYGYGEPKVDSILGSASSTENVLPYLERTLGPHYKRIMDGKEHIPTAEEIRLNRSRHRSYHWAL